MEDSNPASEKGFFTRHPVFTKTSTVSADIDRLDFRYTHVIERNIEILKDKTVVDLASHDGRFSFAALEGAGAKKVIGIEAREHLVQNARDTFSKFVEDSSRYEFHVGDIFDHLPNLRDLSADTIMILGFMYHTARQYEILKSISDAGIDNIILDSNVLRKVDQPYMLLKMEPTEKDSAIYDAHRPKALTAVPSKRALVLLLKEFGYKADVLKPTTDVPLSAKGYATGRRVTIVGRR
jgi:hypothetical protein